MIVVTGAQIVAAARIGLAVSLVGADGSTWNLVDGPVRLRAGVAGLGSPDPERWWQDSPAVDGSFHLGSRIPRGEVTLPIRITEDTSLGWRDTQSAFMRAVDPSGVCYLQIRASDTTARTVGMRLTAGLAAPYEIDPLVIAHAPYTLEFATEYPYWAGVDVSYTWTGTAQIPTTITTGKPVTNPGDVPAWPTWTLGGPWVNAWVGPDQASLIKMLSTTAATAGNARVIDTDPRATAVRVRDATGTDQWAEVVSRVFAPIPVGDTTVRILATSASSLTSFNLAFTAAHRQPW